MNMYDCKIEVEKMREDVRIGGKGTKDIIPLLA